MGLTLGISINPQTTPSTLVLLQTVISHKLVRYCSGCGNWTSKLLLELLISSGRLPCVNKLFLINLLLQGSRQGSDGWREYFPSLTLVLQSLGEVSILLLGQSWLLQTHTRGSPLLASGGHPGNPKH